MSAIKLGGKPAFANVPKKEAPPPQPTPPPASGQPYYKPNPPNKPPKADEILAICKELHKREKASGIAVGRLSKQGAPWEEVVTIAHMQHQMSETDVEECLNWLMDQAILYEPVLGRLVPTDDSS